MKPESHDAAGDDQAPAAPAPQVDLAQESVAGEEDPGASLDVVVDAPGKSKRREEGGAQSGSG
jgi:hypothetical protein